MTKAKKPWWRRWLPWEPASPQVSVVRLTGVIGTDQFGRGLSLGAMAETLERAFTAGKPKAVALLINSPGGSPVQSGLLHDRIRALSAQHRVKVFAFAEDVAASGGYMLMLAGDELFAHAHSIIGSIGVVSAGFGFDRMIEKIGVDRRVYTAGTSKAMLDPFQPERESDVAHLKALQAEVHDGFVAMVKGRRAGRLQHDDQTLFNGAFWTGATAKTMGLVDSIGDVRGIMRASFGEDVVLRVFAPRSGWRLFNREAPAASALLAPQQWLAALEERQLWARYGL
ncbi:MAG TPA: S49 family peptidase [Alphaproteobacteria bacterium]|nr:S49 family peptidase [Alphaproteobacteria bacterium]HAJ47236.1 S49 family peptidase [Alphaproteobacteria bacterium]